jgi:hypothetical protein
MRQPTSDTTPKISIVQAILVPSNSTVDRPSWSFKELALAASNLGIELVGALRISTQR